MKHLHHLRYPLLLAVLPAAAAMRSVAARPEQEDALVEGAQLGLQAYSRASDAYAESFMSPSVALWSLGIAVAVVLLEWLLARGRR
ncbi:MAG TPA: hypothetical protein VHL79_04755 [Ramlibacter sp.]|jgi:hypothetical protein|nr:hypothetical protein [Ramlibacter sp.]